MAGQPGEHDCISYAPGNHDMILMVLCAANDDGIRSWIRADDGSIGFPYLRRRGEVAIIGMSSAVATARSWRPARSANRNSNASRNSWAKQVGGHVSDHLGPSSLTERADKDSAV